MGRGCVMLLCVQENFGCGGCSALPRGCSRDSPLCLPGGEGIKIQPSVCLEASAHPSSPNDEGLWKPQHRVHIENIPCSVHTFQGCTFLRLVFPRGCQLCNRKMYLYISSLLSTSPSLPNLCTASETQECLCLYLLTSWGGPLQRRGQGCVSGSKCFKKWEFASGHNNCLL